MPGISNFYIGSALPSGTAGVPHYERVRFRGVFPGWICFGCAAIQTRSISFMSRRGRSEGASKCASLDFAAISVDPSGDLLLQSPGVWSAPAAAGLPNRPMARSPNRCRLSSKRRHLGFRLPLTGPTCRSSLTPPLPTRLPGGSGYDAANGVTVDSAETSMWSVRPGPTIFSVRDSEEPHELTGMPLVAKFDVSGSLVYKTVSGAVAMIVAWASQSIRRVYAYVAG